MMPRGHIMENIEKPTAVETAAEATTTVSVDLTKEQYAFLTGWQKTHEKELGIEVPIGALVRKTVEAAMNAAKREVRPERGGDKPSFGDRGAPRGRPSFGGDARAPRGRPAGRGPKFDMLSRGKERKFS